MFQLSIFNLSFEVPPGQSYTKIHRLEVGMAVLDWCFQADFGKVAKAEIQRSEGHRLTGMESCSCGHGLASSDAMMLENAILYPMLAPHRRARSACSPKAAQIRLDAEQLMSLALHLLPFLVGKMNKNAVIFETNLLAKKHERIKEPCTVCLKKAS